MTKETFYFYNYYSFIGRVSFAKSRGEPLVKSVNGGGKQRIINKVEITEEQFNNVNLVDLQKIFFPTVEARHEPI